MRINTIFHIILSGILFYSCKQDAQKAHVITCLQPADTIIQVSGPLYNKTTLELYLDSLGFIDIKEKCPGIIIDLKYATSDNFTGKVLYHDLSLAYLHPLAAEKLMKAERLLKNKYPNLNILVYDAARPLSIQKRMYEAVKDTKFKAYVADPGRTSLHNYGMAVDLTLCDSIGKALDMGTDFDYFGKLAGIINEELFLQQGLLTQQQILNRKLLRDIMQEAGFTPIRGEWWHFNATSLNNAQKKGILIK